MKSPFAIVTALALLSTTSASAAPQVGDAKPTNPKLPHVLPHVFEPPTPAPTPKPSADPCAQTLTVTPYDVRMPVVLELRRLSGPATTTLAGAKKISTNIDVEVTASKRRLFLGIFAQMTSHDPNNGQTGYYAAMRRPTHVEIPAGCEIASVSKAKGWVHDAGVVKTNSFNLLGHELVTGASCKLVGENGLTTCELALGKVEVKLRPAQVTCTAFELQPKHVMGLFDLKSQAGDTDLDDDRVHLDYRVDLVAHNERVTARSSISIEQIGHDLSRYTGTREEDLFMVAEDAPGCRLAGTFKKSGRIRLTTPAFTDRPTFYKASEEGVLMSAKCVTDTPGLTDSRLLGCGTPELRPITVQLEVDTGAKKKGKWIRHVAG